MKFLRLLLSWIFPAYVPPQRVPIPAQPPPTQPPLAQARRSTLKPDSVWPMIATGPSSSKYSLITDPFCLEPQYIRPFHAVPNDQNTIDTRHLIDMFARPKNTCIAYSNDFTNMKYQVTPWNNNIMNYMVVSSEQVVKVNSKDDIKGYNENMYDDWFHVANVRFEIDDTIEMPIYDKIIDVNKITP